AKKSSTMATNASADARAPLIWSFSSGVCKYGEVWSPVRYPALARMALSVVLVEPLPEGPPMWTIGYPRSGFPRRSRNRRRRPIRYTARSRTASREESAGEGVISINSSMRDDAAWYRSNIAVIGILVSTYAQVCARPPRHLRAGDMVTP